MPIYDNGELVQGDYLGVHADLPVGTDVVELDPEQLPAGDPFKSGKSQVRQVLLQETAGQPLRVRFDAVDPTDSLGTFIPANAQVTFACDPAKLKLVRDSGATADGKVVVTFLGAPSWS